MARRQNWEKYPEFPHLKGKLREQVEARKRHKLVRYMLFRLKTAADQNQDLGASGIYPPGFIEFWLAETPKYMVTANGRKELPDRNRTVHELGGYSEFATKWDVDADLFVYLRHSSVWQEWNATLMRVVPVLGE